MKTVTLRIGWRETHYRILLYLSVRAALEMLCKKKKKHVVKCILIANDSSDDERVDEPQPSTSQITRRRVSKQKKT